jgi:hypothetical protein
MCYPLAQHRQSSHPLLTKGLANDRTLSRQLSPVPSHSNPTALHDTILNPDRKFRNRQKVEPFPVLTLSKLTD